MHIAETYNNFLLMENRAEAGNKLGKEFSGKVNSFCCPSKEIAEELHSDKKLRASFGKVCAFWIYILHEMSFRPYMTDGRNEYSVRTGSNLWYDDAARDYAGRMSDDDERKAVLEWVQSGGIRPRKQAAASLEQALAVYMSIEHRSLQQAFSGIVFRFLKLEIPGLSRSMERGWEKCPMV